MKLKLRVLSKSKALPKSIKEDNNETLLQKTYDS